MNDFFLSMGAAALRGHFEVTGRFYVIQGQADSYECRDVLEIHIRGAPIRSACDAVFVMMNPGGSSPLVDAGSLPFTQAAFVAAQPDRTQYQLMRIMGTQGWARVRVLNLSDLREKSSSVFYERFKRFESLEANDSHSIFSACRREHLLIALSRKAGAPVFLAWGVNPKLKDLSQKALQALSGVDVLGLPHQNGNWAYRHPLPRNNTALNQWSRDTYELLQAAHSSTVP